MKRFIIFENGTFEDFTNAEVLDFTSLKRDADCKILVLNYGPNVFGPSDALFYLNEGEGLKAHGNYYKFENGELRNVLVPNT